MLIIIQAVCFLAICGVALTFFYSKETSIYGDRVKDLDKNKISAKTLTNYKEKILEYGNINTASVRQSNRLLYIHITFDDEINIEKAKEHATKSLELFEEKILKYYDINFILSSNNFTIMGSKNIKIDHVAWNNNLEVKEEKTDEKS